MNMHDVIIVGGGPAGLTAALYAARAGRTTLLLEKMVAGGQMALTDRIENYPGFPGGIGGPELCMQMEGQAAKAGATIAYENVLEIDCAGRRVRTAGGWREACRLVLALGANAKRLDVPGEERLIGRGVSFCATCDGALYRGKRVAVIGGGNSAVEEAIYLAGVGCEVLLVHRRDMLRAEAALSKHALENPAITVAWNSQVTSFIGKDKLEGLILSGGREEPVEGAFVAVGRVPQTELVAGQLALDKHGFIVAGEDCLTNVPGVYAAGDVRAKTLRQVVTAVADGAVAVSME